MPLAVCLLGGCIASACSSVQTKSIFLKSPGEILTTVKLLAELPGGTRLSDYEGLLGGHLRQLIDNSQHRIPAQVYELAGSTAVTSVKLEIHAGAPGRMSWKNVQLYLEGMEKLVCITDAEVDLFALRNFKFLGSTREIGVSFSVKGSRKAEVIAFIFAPDSGRSCAHAIRLYYPTELNEWGH